MGRERKVKGEEVPLEFVLCLQNAALQSIIWNGLAEYCCGYTAKSNCLIFSWFQWILFFQYKDKKLNSGQTTITFEHSVYIFFIRTDLQMMYCFEISQLFFFFFLYSLRTILWTKCNFMKLESHPELCFWEKRPKCIN